MNAFFVIYYWYYFTRLFSFICFSFICFSFICFFFVVAVVICAHSVIDTQLTYGRIQLAVPCTHVCHVANHRQRADVIDRCGVGGVRRHSWRKWPIQFH